MSGLDIEISIINHENRDMVRACLLSLPNSCQGLEWHATVVDNVSNDGSLEMLAAEFSHVGRLANTRRLGFGANHNQVLRPLIEARSARHVLVLNDDTELRPGAVSRMVELMDRSPGLAAVVPTVVDRQGHRAATRLAYPTFGNAWHCDRTDVTEPPDPEHGWLQGCCILLRVASLAQVGVFDERFFLFYEDTDLSLRLTQAGWSLGTCPEATVVHYGHASVLRPELTEITPLQGRRSRYLYLCKHYGPRRARCVTLVGRSVLAARALKTAARARHHGDAALKARARRLGELARFDPRRPLAQELASGLPHLEGRKKAKV